MSADMAERVILDKIAAADSTINDCLTLPFESRQKSRFSAMTDGGLAVGLFLQRGRILRAGTLLTGEDNITVKIEAAKEPVSVVRSRCLPDFARACYHLGNRHVPLQILDGELRYLSDHVLDEMLEKLGFAVTREMLPFEPEAGAYHHHHD